MDFLTLALLTIISYAFYNYFKKTLDHFKDSGIPYVPGWPIVGNLGPVVFGRKHISEVIDDIYYSNPEAQYVGAFDFMTPTVLIRDPELIKSVTIKNFDSFHDHKSLIEHTVDPLMAGTLFNMAGDRWKDAKYLLSPAFTSSKMKSMFPLMQKCVENYVDCLSKRSEEENRMLDTKNFFARFTNDVVATCAFGIEIDSLKNPNNEFYVLGRKGINFDGAMSVKFFLSRSFPEVLKFFKIKFVSSEVAKFFSDIVKTTVETRDEKNIRRPDFLQLLMDARNQNLENYKINNIEMTAQCFAFFLGGFDTTSTEICIVAHELALNPDIQKKLQEEIDEVLKKGKPTFEAIKEMPYLDAVFNESMRRHTQVSLLDRVCTQDFELPPALPGLEPYLVKAGSYVWYSPSAIHKDPKYYENPKKFDPDRYYRKKIGVNDAQNLGFGIGPRACIGNRFSILETKIMIFFLLARFDLKPNEKTTSPLIYNKKNYLVMAEGGFWLSVVPRNKIIS